MDENKTVYVNEEKDGGMSITFFTKPMSGKEALKNLTYIEANLTVALMGAPADDKDELYNWLSALKVAEEALKKVTQEATDENE